MNRDPPGARRFEGNAVHDFLIVIDTGASCDVIGNTICAGRPAIRLAGEADPQLGTNEICEELDSGA